MRAVLTALAVGVVLATAAGQEYRVDPSGGPLTLADEVAAALEAWQQGGGLEPAVETESADFIFEYGDPSAFGPDTLSLTLQRQEGEGAEARRTITSLVEPRAPRRFPTVLVHEAGLFFGLATSQEGAMDPALTETSPDAPTDADLEALRARLTFPPEDLTRDGIVDFYDLAELAAAFGRSGVNLPADLNQDGVVDRADLEILRRAYVFLPPSRDPPRGGGPRPGEEPSEDEGPPTLPEEEAPASGDPGLPGAEDDTGADATDPEPGDGGPEAPPEGAPDETPDEGPGDGSEQ